MNIIPLKAIFKFNKLLYTLLKRNDYVALYGIGGSLDEEAERFELFKILIDRDDSDIIESLPSNDLTQIRENYLRCFNNYNQHLITPVS